MTQAMSPLPVLNRKHQITRGLVFDMPLYEKGGTTVHDIAGGTTGTLTNGPTWVYGANKWTKSSVNMNGGDSKVISFTKATKVDNLTRLSLEFVCNRNTCTGYERIFFKGNNEYWSLANNNGETGWGIAFAAVFTGGYNVWSIPYPDSLPHHYILTYDGTNAAGAVRVWKDGVEQTVTNRATNGGSWTGDTAGVLGVGGNVGASESWRGKMFFARIWNRVLIPAEVRKLMDDPWCIYCKSIIQRLKEPIKKV